MEIYRITLSRWSGELVASGRPARWNSNNRLMIYSAATRALACLENLVHRSGEGLNADFKVCIIQVPEQVAIKKINTAKLPPNWQDGDQYPATQALGDAWLDGLETAILQVPSAIIRQEFNYLINPLHPDFKKIRIRAREEFLFDARIRNMGKQETAKKTRTPD